MLSVVLENATDVKIDQAIRHLRTDKPFEYLGYILYIFFTVLTLFMLFVLVLFAVGFFMAVTHWCDRLAPKFFTAHAATLARY